MNGVLPLLAVGLPLAALGMIGLRLAGAPVNGTLLGMVLGLPLLALPPVMWLAKRAPRRAGLWVAAAAVVAGAGLLALTPEVLRAGAVTFELPVVIDALRFKLDGVGLLFGLIATFVWSAASLYALDYLPADARVRRYHAASLLTLTGLLGLFSAADLLTLYIFFEWLGLAAYLFVVHTETPAAVRAGVKYLSLTLLGGFAVLAGILVLQSVAVGAIGVPWPSEVSEGWRTLAAVLLVAGFGVKAGLLGLHIWLPDAHTAAPSPASALLSGVMIKAGAYGILRSLSILYATEGALLPAVSDLGLVLVAIGALGMFVGVTMAWLQHEAKRLLAFSSVSQMGFILLGIGAAAILAGAEASGGEGAGSAVAWTGALLHILNHALFKALLFLAFGAVIHAVGHGDLRELGGLWRRMPWTFALALVAALGIAGLPGLNGFVSKSILHHALGYAEAVHAAPWLGIAEWAFVLTTFGTAAVLTKLMLLAFAGAPRSAAAERAREVSGPMRAAMGVLALALVLVGLYPQGLAPLLGAAVAALGGSPTGVAGYLMGPLRATSDWLAASQAFVAGVGLHLFGQRLGVYALVVPWYLSLDESLRRLLRGLAAAFAWLAAERDAFETSAWRRIAHECRAFTQLAEERPRRVSRAWLRWRVAVLALIERASSNWEGLDAGEERFMRSVRERIQRESRDLSLNVGVLLVVWLLFLGALWWG